MSQTTLDNPNTGGEEFHPQQPVDQHEESSNFYNRLPQWAQRTIMGVAGLSLAAAGALIGPKVLGSSPENAPRPPKTAAPAVPGSANSAEAHPYPTIKAGTKEMYPENYFGPLSAQELGGKDAAAIAYSYGQLASYIINVPDQPGVDTVAQLTKQVQENGSISDPEELHHLFELRQQFGDRGEPTWYELRGAEIDGSKEQGAFIINGSVNLSPYGSKYPNQLTLVNAKFSYHQANTGGTHKAGWSLDSIQYGKNK